MGKKIIAREINMPEFILRSLESVHYVIFETLATGFESFEEASENYLTRDIDCRFRNYLDRIRSDLFTPEDELNIANSLEALWWDEEKNPHIDPNLIAVAKGEAFELVQKSNLSNHLIILSDIAAFYYAKATYNLENKLLDHACINLHAAGIAAGRIYGIQEELRRKDFLKDTGSILGQTVITQKTQNAFRERQIHAAKVKADNQPTNKDKEYIKGCYLDWRNEPEIYGSILEFAKIMRRDCKTAKCDTDTIKKWVNEWDAESEIKNHWENFQKNPSQYKANARFIDAMVGKYEKRKISRKKIEEWVYQLTPTLSNKTTIMPAR
jgi:hypothetical protein